MTQEDHRAESEMIPGGDSEESAPVSSESGQDAAAIPDGSGNDLPQEKSPNDDDESFDAG
ncbi:hypothetical protein [Arthrobacter sp. ISL-65]|uniref:hypothetical protein n=1 Tax=Arthrobacter sp. ISL-65 TaxID=2819112 RepID=UPI001BE8276D|nr:hypothetical protein [Arthrobacter sp. ISL-65]MBT2550991.1 hypothetical protein [Arthrobacter sp. ISL-65]